MLLKMVHLFQTTNSDVINALFNPTDIRELTYCVFADIGDRSDLRIDKEFWYAPYRKESK